MARNIKKGPLSKRARLRRHVATVLVAASLTLAQIPQPSHAVPPSPAETRELVSSTTTSRSSFKDMWSLWNEEIDFESNDKKSDDLELFDFEAAKAKEQEEAATPSPSVPPTNNVQTEGEAAAMPPTTEATPKATTPQVAKVKSPKEAPAKKKIQKTFRKPTHKQKKISKVKRNDNKKRIGLKNKWFQSKQPKPKVALPSKKKKVVVVAARTTVALAAAVVGTLWVIGGQDDDDEEESSVFLEKKRQTTDSRSNDSGTNKADQNMTNTGKQLPPVNIKDMSARSRAMQAKMILNDIRESREKRKQAMEESHERVQAIQAQINATDEQLAAKKEATQSSLQRLRQVQTKDEQESSDELSSIERRQQQRALNIAKSEQKRLRRKQVQKNEEIRLRIEREMKSRKKTPAQIRAAQKEEQTRRTLMENSYVGKELDLLEEQRKQRQQKLEAEEKLHMQELQKKYNGVEDKEGLDVESTVLKDASVDQKPLSPKPPNVPSSLDAFTSAQKAQELFKNTEPFSSGDTRVGSDEDSDRETAPSGSPPTPTKTTSSTLSKRTEYLDALKLEQKREAFARALLASRLALESNARQDALVSQTVSPSNQEKASKEALGRLKQKKELAARAVLEARLARGSRVFQPLNSQAEGDLEKRSASSCNTNVDELKKRKRSFSTARALMQTRFAMETKARAKKQDDERVEKLKKESYNTARANASATRESVVDESTKEQQENEEIARRNMLLMRLTAKQSSNVATVAVPLETTQESFTVKIEDPIKLDEQKKNELIDHASDKVYQRQIPIEEPSNVQSSDTVTKEIAALSAPASDSVRWSADTIASLGLKAKLSMMSAAGVEVDISEMEPTVDSTLSSQPLNGAEQASQTGATLESGVSGSFRSGFW